MLFIRMLQRKKIIEYLRSRGYYNYHESSYCFHGPDEAGRESTVMVFTYLLIGFSYWTPKGETHFNTLRELKQLLGGDNKKEYVEMFL